MKTKALGNDSGDQVLVFDKGEEVVAALTEFVTKQRISAAHFSAIGALSDAVLGYFDRARKDYKRIPVRDQVEGHVWPTLELILTPSPRPLRRRMDPETGLALLDPAA